MLEPTIRAGEVIQVDRNAYRDRLPERWDLIAFHPVHHPERLWILRVAGLPGEELSTERGRLIADGRVLDMPFPWRSLEYESRDYTSDQLVLPLRIRRGEYFVLGDNAREANDSRFWGTIPLSCIIGKVVPRVGDPPDRYETPSGTGESRR